MYHRWFLQVLYTELACPGEGYDPPAIAAVGNGDSDSSGLSSCEVVKGAGLPTVRARVPSLRLDALLSHRPISDIQVQSEKYPSMRPFLKCGNED